MRLITWNVNGLRSLKKSVQEIIKGFEGDVVGFQETKISRNQLLEDTAMFSGFTSYFSFPHRQSGYSGVATYSSDQCCPSKAEDGLFSDEKECQGLDETLLFDMDLHSLDGEGRAVVTHHKIQYTATIKTLSIINVYCPRVDPEKPERHLYKMQFLDLLAAKAHSLLQKNGFVIIMGDMNIAHRIIDSCEPGDQEEFDKAEHRQWMTSFLQGNKAHYKEPFIDAFRYFHPDQKEAYTCWNTKTGARQTNYGTRIDYFLVNQSMLPLLESCEILTDVYGSDHCPVLLNLICDMVPSQQVPSICTKLWPEFAGRQQKLSNFLCKLNTTNENLTSKNKFLLEDQPTPKKMKSSNQKSIKNFFRSNNKNNGRLTNKEIEKSTGSDNLDRKDIIDTTISQEIQDCSQLSESRNKQSSAWKSMLSGPPKPPSCPGHNKPCVLRTVRKAGINCGRQFFSCPQPSGPESNPESCCNFFQWVTPMKKLTSKKP